MAVDRDTGIAEWAEYEGLHAAGRVAQDVGGLEQRVRLENPQVQLDADMAREVIWNVYQMILDTHLSAGPNKYGHNDPLYQVIAIKAYMQKALGLKGDLA